MQIIFYYLLIQLICVLLFKRDSSFLLCGMGAVSLKDNLSPAQLALATMKMKVIGLYNETRGRDGCGWYINGEIYKGYHGTNNTKTFDKFIEWEQLPNINQEFGNTSILHCRQASSGVVKKENNHPFDITGTKSHIIFQHNGTIKNISELCKSYDLSYTKFDVDSEALGTIIANGNIQVLNNYTGYAALLWTDVNNTDVLYAYHGSSKKSLNATDVEERPLYFMETDEGIYFSSMCEALWAIAEKDQKPYNLNYNIVFKIKNGSFVKTQIKINRCVNPEYISNSYSTTEWKNATQSPILDVYKESKPKNANGNRVFFWKLRYWMPDGTTLINGIYNLNKKGEIIHTPDSSSNKYCFFHGMLANNAEDYVKCLAEYENSIKNKSTCAFGVSKYISHPIRHLPEELMPSYNSTFTYYNGFSSYTKEFSPKFSGGRTYKFNMGDLKEIQVSVKTDVVFATEKQLEINKAINTKQSADNVFTNTIFKSFEEFSQKITNKELCCLFEYCQTQLEMAQPLIIDVDETKYYTFETVREAIKNKTTIAEEFNDDGGWVLDNYLNWGGGSALAYWGLSSQEITVVSPPVSNFEISFESVLQLVETLSYMELYTIVDIENEENNKLAVPKNHNVLMDVIKGHFRSIVHLGQSISEYYQQEVSYLDDMASDFQSGSIGRDAQLYSIMVNYFNVFTEYLNTTTKETTAFEVIEDEDDVTENSFLLEQAKDEIVDIIDTVESLIQSADNLQRIDVDIAQEFSSIIYRQTQNLTNGFIEHIDGLIYEEQASFKEEKRKLQDLYSKQISV